MTEQPRSVTRREFYAGLGTTMNMVGIVALQTVRSQDSILREIGALIIAIAAIACGSIYIVIALRDKPARAIPDATSPPSRGTD